MVNRRARLPVLVAILILTLLGLLTLAGWRLMDLEREQAATKVNTLLRARLRDLRARVTELMQAKERELEELTTWPARLNPDRMRRQLRNTGMASQTFALDQTGRLLYPNPRGPWIASESAFLRRASRLINTRHFIHACNNPEQPPKKYTITVRIPRQQAVANVPVSPQQTRNAYPSTQITHGWVPLFWEHGIQLIYWRRDRHGRIVGAEIPRIRLLSDIVAVLPARSATDMAGTHIILRDSQGKIIYQWGDFTFKDKNPKRVSMALAPPLVSWSLACIVARDHLPGPGRTSMFAIWIAGSSALLVLGLIAWLIIRESSRVLREAAQRVNFVNQASHELKTPLTNIRLYAELTRGQLDARNNTALRNLDVVISESQRLGRLIGNILAFSRQQRGALRVRPTPAIPDQIIARVLDNFAPAFSRRNITVQTELNAKEQLAFDTDILEQCLGNLLSNAEKYAPDGKVTVCSCVQTGMIRIEINDSGPGIPAHKREAIFMPFVRLSDALTEGVSGTGIGLTIARSLARLHGGDLVLAEHTGGAGFVLTLNSEIGGGNNK